MNVATGQIISRTTGPALCFGAIFGIACLFIISCSFASSQTAIKDKDRKKNFGKSLDKFKKKIGDTSGKDKKNDAPGDDVIRVETNMVVTDVLVVNPKGNALIGLKKEDFVITENGVPQEIE